MNIVETITELFYPDFDNDCCVFDRLRAYQDRLVIGPRLIGEFRNSAVLRLPHRSAIIVEKSHRHSALLGLKL
jgi:hypothetical protein